jgi:uncharacterized membrane protein YgcG
MNRAMRLLAPLLAALAFLLPGTALADERILSWRSDIEVRADGALEVTETIRVTVEGNRIQRGIFRDFPTTYDRDGRRVRVGFDIRGVERDGRPEPYATEGVGNGIRVRIGNADTYVEHGVHTYVVRYTTTRQLGFFDGYDELYWNVTGNGWVFPIDRAEAHIRLPEPVPFGPERAFYTGTQGSTARDAQVVSESPGQIAIRTTRPLGSYEGLTVAVRWPKGVIAEPPRPSAARQRLQDEAPLWAALAALLGLAGYYYYAWKKAGRGPRAGTVVPLFTPPEGMSAAALRFVKRMNFDDRCFAAAIVESGVHRELKMEEHDKGIFHRTKTTLLKTTGRGGLAQPERSMLSALFAGSDRIEMDDANRARFGAARTARKEGLDDAYEGKLFARNLGWAWLGIALLFTAMLFVATAIALSDFYTTPAERTVPALGLALMLAAFLLLRRPRKGWQFGVLKAALMLGGIGLFGLAFVRLTQVEDFATWIWMLAPLLALPLIVSAFAWMSAPTREGREVMDRIAGFEQYLSITEEERLETLHPPEKTPGLFERYLPHAIALGVENRWADKFADVLEAAAADPGSQGSTFGWYSGSSNAWSNPGRFAGTMGAALANSVAAASTAPGSSSGSGGGGSSGGGGGGGGGGGW